MNKKNENIRQRKGELKDVKREVQSTGKSAKKNKRKISASNGTETTFHRIWTRTVVIFCAMVVVYFFATRGKEKKFASVQERNLVRFQNLTCSPEFNLDVSKFPKCAPSYCGRFVNDRLIHMREVEVLFDLAKNGIAIGGDGDSILDLHTGTVTALNTSVDIYNTTKDANLFSEELLLAYKNIKLKIRRAISEQFMIEADSLNLAYPSFISKTTNVTAKQFPDKYYQPHVDREKYEGYHFTSHVYLADYGKDFTGGRFIFIDNKVNMTIEPVRGRVNIFTSGAENLHFVERVYTGVRYALTVSFTCNPRYFSSEPPLKPRDSSNPLITINLNLGKKKNET